MAERAAAYEGVQIGAETTAGTGVSASKKLFATLLGPIKGNVPVIQVEGAGSQDPVAAYVGHEWSSMAINGAMSYNDLSYLLGMHLQAGTPGATFVFAPNSLGANTLKTMSIERGSSVRAEKAYYCFCPDLQLRFTLRECSVGGQIVGRARQEGATLTTTPTVIPPSPVGVKDWQVLVGANVDGSSATALTRCKEAEFNSQGKWAPGFFAVSGQDSFVAPIELKGNRVIRFGVEQDSEGAAFMADQRAANLKYVKIAAARSGLALNIEAVGTIQESDPRDTDDLSMIYYEVKPQYNSGFNTTGGALKISVTGTISAY